MLESYCSFPLIDDWMHTFSILIKILLRHLYRAPSGVSRRQRHAMGQAELKYHANSNGWGWACMQRCRAGGHVRSVVGRLAPPCQRSEVNGDLSPYSGLQGRDIVPFWSSRTSLTSKLALRIIPSHKVLATRSLHLHLRWEGCGSTRRKDKGGGGRPCRCRWARARAQEKCALPVSLASTSRHTGTCQHPGGRAHRGWRGWGPLASVPPSVFTVFKVLQRARLSGGWLNEWHNKKWNN